MSKAQVSQQRQEAHRRSSEKSAQRRERKSRRVATGGHIYPDVYYEVVESLNFIGCGPTQFWEQVKLGHLPKPYAPYPGSSKRGFYGRTLLQIQAQAEART